MNRIKRIKMKHKKDLIAYLIDVGHEEEQAVESVESAYIGYIKDYFPDCPAWCGNAIVVIWSAGIEYYEVFGYIEGELKPIEQDLGFKSD